MVKMIKGIYGYRKSNGEIIPKTLKDGPFSITKEQEERLVKVGVAEYVNGLPEKSEQPENGSEEELSGQDESEPDEDMDSSMFPTEEPV